MPFIAVAWGWQWVFILKGVLGFIWLILWFIYYEVPKKQKRLSAEELEYINSDKDETAAQEIAGAKLSWGKLLSYKQTWAFAIGKFLTDPYGGFIYSGCQIFWKVNIILLLQKLPCLWRQYICFQPLEV